MPSREETEQLHQRRRRRWEGAGARHGPGAASQGCPLLLWSAPGRPHVPCPLFFKFLSQRGCQGRGIVKSSPPCHECTRSSGASGQKLFAISSGRDLCFDHGGGGLQSIKPSPGPCRGQGRGLPSAGGGEVPVQGAQGHPFAPRVWSRGWAGGTHQCSLSWQLKLPDGGFREASHHVCHKICSCWRYVTVCFNFLSQEGCRIAICWISRVGKDVLQGLCLELALEGGQLHQDLTFSLEKTGNASRFTISKALATNGP